MFDELMNMISGFVSNTGLTKVLAGSEKMKTLTIRAGVSAAILLAFWISRRVITRFVSRLLLRITSRTKTNFDNHLAEAFESSLRHFWVLLGIYFALAYLPLSPGQDLLLSRFFRSSIIILIAMGFYNLAGRCGELCDDLGNVFGINVDRILIPFFSKVFKVIIAALALSIIAQEWNYDVNSLIAGLGLGGLAFALAAKDTAANIFGGIVIITDKPFSIGDWVLTPSVEGTVEDINFRSTKIRTFAQAVVTVPNATLANEPVTNYTRMGKRRISFNLGITYGTPRDKLQNCVHEIQNMLENHPDIHKETIFVRFDSFGASSLDIFLYFFTETTVWAEFLRVKEDINFKIMDILEREGVSVAFPSTSVYFENALETVLKTD